ncbi:MAG: hypothetical protein JHD16_11370 [Solirubrobacteraceae bacterium]|nr:hypothetical protein [Solirubrobacteraceae bacterium]
MLDPRLTRIFVLPLLAVLVLAAFSVQDRPRALRTFQAPDAFSGTAALAEVTRLAGVYPARPAGGPADTDAGRDIEQRFEADGLEVRTETAQVISPDGSDAEALQVTGERPGPKEGTIVIVAPRDGVRAGSRAELTGTATLLQLSSLLGKRRVEHPIQLVSVSGTMAQSGYRALARRLQSDDSPVRAVIVLGTLGTPDLLPPVVTFSNGPELASARLRRTIEEAIRNERSVGDARPGAVAQLVRLAAPVTTGGQGPLLRDGLPAILFSTSGDRVPPVDARPTAERMEADGRALLTSVIAIDNAGTVDLSPEQRLSAADGIIPGWALRAIVLALLIPPGLLIVDGLARARRQRQRVGRWVVWTLLLALPQLLGIGAVALAASAGWVDLPGGPIDPALWTGDLAPLVVFTVVAILGHFVLRPLLLFALGLRGQRSSGPGAPLALALVLEIAALATWVVNPAAAAVMVPAVVIWPVVLDSGMRPGRVAAIFGVVVGLLPLLILLENVLTRYPLGDVASSASWFIGLLSAGGVGLFAQLWFAVLTGCGLGALLLARHGRFSDPGDAEVTVRGPVTYAGPGSLGGVPSALER